jgi:hypothetical protein
MFRPDVGPTDGAPLGALEVSGDIVQVSIGQTVNLKAFAMATAIACRAEAEDPDCARAAFPFNFEN